MDIARIEQLRDELLHNRKYAAIAAVLVLGFWVVTLAGGYLLFKRAMEDNRPAVASVVNVPTKFASLVSDNRNEVLNHIVFFNDVHLESGPVDNVYYAVGAAGDRVLVISQGKKSFSEGEQVDVKGTVRSVPTSATLKKWKLDKDEQKALKDQGIYVEADEIIARRTKAAPARVAKK
jgi:hypothetical protein